MKKCNVPLLILNEKQPIVALDYLNKKIIYINSKIQLSSNKVYLVKITGVHNKKGYSIELIKEAPIGEYNIDEFIIKCQMIEYHDFVSDFNYILTFTNKKKSLHLVRFSKSILKKYSNKYQLKMGKKYVNIVDYSEDLNSHINHIYSGYVLIMKELKGNKALYYGLKLFGSFYGVEEVLEEPISTLIDKNYDIKDNFRITIDMIHETLISKNRFLSDRYHEEDYQDYGPHPSDDYQELELYDYSQYETDITYDIDIEDENGYEAYELFNSYKVEKSVYEKELTDNSMIINYPKEFPFTGSQSNQTQNIMDDIHDDDYNKMIKKIHKSDKFYNRYEITLGNKIVLLDYLKSYDLIKNKLKTLAFEDICNEIMNYIYHNNHGGMSNHNRINAQYMIDSIEDLEFSINYEINNELINFLKTTDVEAFLEGIFSLYEVNNSDPDDIDLMNLEDDNEESLNNSDLDTILDSSDDVIPF